jgi:hypothetical protein
MKTWPKRFGFECFSSQIRMMHYRKYQTMLALIFLALGYNAAAQEADSAQATSQHITLVTRFSQYKDSNNYGLAFSGLGVLGRYTFSKKSVRTNFSYCGALGTDIIFNKGAGFALVFNPIDVGYGIRVNRKSSMPFYVGAYVATRYNWQFYPFTTSAFMHWMTSIEMGPRLTFYPTYSSKRIKIQLSNSLFGWVSRSQPPSEVYFFELGFSDFVKNAHKDFESGSFGTFNHTNLQVAIQRSNKAAIAYEFDYYGFYDTPAISIIFHSFSLTWTL